MRKRDYKKVVQRRWVLSIPSLAAQRRAQDLAKWHMAYEAMQCLRAMVGASAGDNQDVRLAAMFLVSYLEDPEKLEPELRFSIAETYERYVEHFGPLMLTTNVDL